MKMTLLEDAPWIGWREEKMANVQEVYRIEGMSCNHCKLAVEKEVGKLVGMESAEVDLGAKTLTVSYDPTQTNADKIREAIEEAGFNPV